MKILRTLAIGAALIAGSSGLAAAQPQDRDRDHDRDRGRFEHRDRDDRRFRDRDDRRFDRDDWRFRGDRDDRHFAGQRRYYNGFYWDWDGYRWYRHDNRGLTFYLNF